MRSLDMPFNLKSLVLSVVLAPSLLVSVAHGAQGAQGSQLGETFSIERKYESDSGYAHENECVLNRYSPQGKFLNTILLHDWVEAPSAENVFCKNLQKNEVSVRMYKIVSVENSEMGCLQFVTQNENVKPFFVDNRLCGL
jgi:hypothetical protein